MLTYTFISMQHTFIKIPVSVHVAVLQISAD